ncbi:hypothetical protein [Novosphingobium sp. Leaf2]|uniref:hypothetical protein n=1 Tax=Novosphingobium sp. Leaf2 TaxID=1735670 RepID=UPI0006F37590|nr:hypothetical protein [Novosphingobium sp. Leaf2]KQM18225.1 hypothetical protein ASE49_08320 [Novosphingobium sp. Leaf2]
MVDILALAISHALLLIAAWRLLWRPELDVEGATAAEPRKVRRGIGTAMRTGQEQQSDSPASDTDPRRDD